MNGIVSRGQGARAALIAFFPGDAVKKYYGLAELINTLDIPLVNDALELAAWCKAGDTGFLGWYE